MWSIVLMCLLIPLCLFLLKFGEAVNQERFVVVKGGSAAADAQEMSLWDSLKAIW